MLSTKIIHLEAYHQITVLKGGNIRKQTDLGFAFSRGNEITTKSNEFLNYIIIFSVLTGIHENSYEGGYLTNGKLENESPQIILRDRKNLEGL